MRTESRNGRAASGYGLPMSSEAKPRPEPWFSLRVCVVTNVSQCCHLRCHRVVAVIMEKLALRLSYLKGERERFYFYKGHFFTAL